jgi:murein DD-endopeptidase MepM/ murein hydrolase activator NlpD
MRILLALLLLTTPAGTDAPRWNWPTAQNHTIVRAFLAPAHGYGAGHRGIDISVPLDSVVLAPDDGTVEFAGVVVDRPVLSIVHDGGLVSSFEPVSSALKPGDRVRRGETIGQVVDSGGHCPQPCLHFGVRLHGQYVSPLLYLGGGIRPVLLPFGDRQD